MSLTNTNIKLQRSVNTPAELASQELYFGEPLFIDNTTHNELDGKLLEPCNAYLVIGRKPSSETDKVTVDKSPVIKAFTLDKSDKLVFYNSDNGSIINESNVELPVNRLTTASITDADLDATGANKYYILCQPEGDNRVYKFTFEDLGIFVNSRGISQGIAWNDYAELRRCNESVLPGQIVCDTGNGDVELSKERLQACAHVVSDTYGHLIGDNKEESVPIAVAGRVLVAMDNTLSSVKIGDCVCADANGLASKMTRKEIINYPDRILGVVCEIPNYNNIGSIDIDDRVWINVK